MNSVKISDSFLKNGFLFEKNNGITQETASLSSVPRSGSFLRAWSEVGYFPLQKTFLKSGSLCLVGEMKVLFYDEKERYTHSEMCWNSIVNEGDPGLFEVYFFLFSLKKAS